MLKINKIIFDDIEKDVKDTIKQYYNMNEEQRQFIYSLLEHEDIKWSKLDLIKSLLIFNKCKDLNINIVNSKSDEIFNYIDFQNQKRINNLILQFDKLFLIKN